MNETAMDKMDNERFDSMARWSGIPILTHMKCRLFTFMPNDGTQSAYDAALQFIGVSADGEPLREHHFLTLGGEPGRGKTHLALGIGWHWLEVMRQMVKYYHVAELLDTIRSEYDNPPKDSYGFPMKSCYQHCENISLLILDDLGAEKRTPWVDEKLDMLIDHRWLNEMPTVITTNKLLSQLPPRVSSRLKEGVTVALEGPDYREVKARMRNKELV